jgi:hypothetical protein
MTSFAGNALPAGEKGVRTKLQHDEVEIIDEFLESAPGRGLQVETIELASHKTAEPLAHVTVEEEEDELPSTEAHA